jgi:hypothetical protein
LRREPLEEGRDGLEENHYASYSIANSIPRYFDARFDNFDSSSRSAIMTPSKTPLPQPWRPPGEQWQLRDFAAAAGLFIATASVVLWQNAHVAVLWDASYTLDSATRIALGQMPYRDFPFVHAPLTFLIQAAIIRLTGRVFFHHVLYAAVMAGVGTVLAWRIVLRSLCIRVQFAWAIALLLAAPLTFLSVYSVLPFPSYDCDCALAILLAVWCLQRLDTAPANSPLARWRGFATGCAVCLPLFVKQNMGLPFLLAAVGSVALLLCVRLFRREKPGSDQVSGTTLLALLAGAITTIFAALLVLYFTAGVGNYIHWTIQFAAQRRLPSLPAMAAIYSDSSLRWTLPAAAAALILLTWRPFRLTSIPAGRAISIAAFLLLAAPFFFALSALWLYYDDPDSFGDTLMTLWPFLMLLAAALVLRNFIRFRSLTLRSFLALILLAAIQGSMLSQQLWGSTYAIWPLLAILIAELLVFLSGLPSLHAVHRWFLPSLAGFASITLLVCGAFYTFSEERLSYVNIPDGPVEHSAFPQLAGASTPGPYLPELDEFLRYASANIPQDDGIILLPGEDPFFFVTGRTPQFPVLLFDRSTDPYSPEETAALVRAHNIRWLVIKHDLQIKEDATPNRAVTLDLLAREFFPVAHLRGFDVYRRP